MARSKPYAIILSDKRPHVIPRYLFADLLSRRLITLSGDRRGKVAAGYDARFTDDQLIFERRGIRIEYSIRSSWDQVERARVYGRRGIIDGVERQRAIQEMCHPARTERNEILIRRQFE